MVRHVKLYCKIANTEEGMEMLMEHTLQRQLAEMEARMKSEMKSQMAEITSLLKAQGASGSLVPSRSSTVNAEGQTTINAGPVGTQTNIGQLAQTIVNIHPWDGDDFIRVPVSLIAAAFTENPRLVEYCRLDDASKADAAIAAPYVVEALVDLTRRAHADPLSRNIYLSPKRADQVMVCLKDGRWEVRPLNNASRTLFDGIASRISRAILADAERRQLPLDVQASACFVPMLYEDDPEEYVRKAKVPLASHLANTAPSDRK